MTPSEFAAKWSESTAKESAGAKEHFIDLCRLLGYQTPNEADPTGDWYAFEKGAEKTAGGDGFADVWKRGHFAWEYKGKRKDLAAAYKQLLDYREALENPPLLVVCDLDRFEVHTNFTGTVKQVHAFSLADLAATPQEPLRILRAVMGDPEALRPQKTPEELTEQAAREFARLALALRDRGHEGQAVAHFLDQLLFCLFARCYGDVIDDGKEPRVDLGRANVKEVGCWDGSVRRSVVDDIPRLWGGLRAPHPVLTRSPSVAGARRFLRRGTIRISASRAAAIAATVRSSGFTLAVKSRRTAASFRPIARASRALLIPASTRSSSSALMTSLIWSSSRRARSYSSRSSGSRSLWADRFL
jgi:hypothetical protein